MDAPAPRAWMFRSLLLAGFAVALGQALLLHNDLQPPLAWFWFDLALASLALAVLLPVERLPALAGLDRFGEDPVLALGTLALILQVWQLCTHSVSWSIKPGGPIAERLALAAIACGALAVLGLGRGSPLGRARFPLLIAAHAAVGLYVVAVTPNPWIDVYQLHVLSIRDLLQGRSPYGRVTPNMYRGMPFYAPSLLSADGATVKLGFPYPPLQLLLAVPGQLLAGDYRVVQALALTASGALMALARPGRIAGAAAALFLLTPRFFLTIEGSWTEPMVVFFLSLTLFCARRAPRALPWALGGFFAIKQYAVLLAPVAFFLLPSQQRSWRDLERLLVRALLLAAALSLPFLLWTPQGFLDDVLLFQVRQPFRSDSFSAAALLFLRARVVLPAALGFAAYAVVLALGAWRTARDPGAFAGCGALAFLVFFTLGKQAFANYYTFVLALGAWALALSGPGEDGAAAAAAADASVGSSGP